MAEEYLQTLTGSLLRSDETQARSNFHSKLFNLLSPPEPGLREIAQSFVLTKNKAKGKSVAPTPQLNELKRGGWAKASCRPMWTFSD